MMLVLTGILLVIAGLVIQVAQPPPPEAGRTFQVNILSLQYATDHPGFAIIGLGVIVLVVGYVGAAIWTSVKTK